MIEKRRRGCLEKCIIYIYRNEIEYAKDGANEENDGKEHQNLFIIDILNRVYELVKNKEKYTFSTTIKIPYLKDP